MKKLFIILFILIAVWLFFRFPRSYTLKYKVDKYTIVETYNKKVHGYLFTIDNKYDVGVSSRYVGKHMIKSIKTDSKNKDCINVKSKKLVIEPLCQNDGKQVMSSIYKETKEKKGRKYKNIEIYNLKGKTVAVWNHLGYYLLSDKKNIDVQFLKEEQYYNNSAFISGKYLITPNYDEEYEFSNFEIIDLKKQKESTIQLDEKLNYNYYYLGTYKDKTYLIDKKNYKEYILNISKGKISDITDDNYGKVFDKKWKDVPIKKLVNKKYTFDTYKLYNYYLEDNQLYLQYYKKENNIKVSNLIIKEIIAYNNEEVMYISEDSLYYYSPLSGEIKMLSFTELNFNSHNQLFVY